MTDTLNKLVRWDADYYKALSDDDCIVCLTERQVYLLGQILEQLTWARTRWYGDISDLDFKAIAGNLEYRLAERMTCTNLTTILDTVRELEKIVRDIQRTVDDIQNPAPDFDSDTSMRDKFGQEELEDFVVATDGCDTEDKDALYAGIRELVTYIHNVNLDALQQIAQLANIPQQIDNLIESTPLGILPADDAFGWAEFVIEELSEEYEATVDEALLENVVCDLFCIAVNSNCRISWTDVINYFGGKVSGGDFIGVLTDLANVVNFVFTGTFTGDDYFYYLCLFQLMSVALNDHYFNAKNMQYYMTRVLTGMNSPDGDWALLCDACPTQYRLWTHDFADGMGEFEISLSGSTPLGTYENGRIKGFDAGSSRQAQVYWTHAHPEWRIRGAKLYMERVNGGGSGSDNMRVSARATAGSDVGRTDIFASTGAPTGVLAYCGYIAASPFYVGAGVELVLDARVNDPSNTSQIYIDKIEILFEMQYAPVDSAVTLDDNICL